MSHLIDVTRSCQRCLEIPEFFDTFFRELPSRAPAVFDLVEGSEGVVLRSFLRNAIALVLLDAAGSQQARERLSRIRTLHGQKGLNLNLEDCSHCIESLMVAIREHDPEYTPSLGHKWRTILEAGARQVAPVAGP